MKRPSDPAAGLGAPDETLRQRRSAGRVQRRQIASRRIAPEERERMILQGAVSFFAEYGFEGQTRELARRLGITQPLLYRYFSDKATLIDRVFREVFLDRWSPQWRAWIVDCAHPLPERLTRFYQDYARVILSYEWVRLFVFSGLKGLDTAKHYAEALVARVYPSVIGEIRLARGDPPLAESPMTEAEAERLWSLHGAIFYLGVRRWIYRLPVPEDQDAAVAARVAAFLDDAPGALRDTAPPVRAGRRQFEALAQWSDPGAGSSAVELLSRD